jgi:hypothetical protein
LKTAGRCPGFSAGPLTGYGIRQVTPAFSRSAAIHHDERNTPMTARPLLVGLALVLAPLLTAHRLQGGTTKDCCCIMVSTVQSLQMMQVPCIVDGVDDCFASACTYQTLASTGVATLKDVKVGDKFILQKALQGLKDDQVKIVHVKKNKEKAKKEKAKEFKTIKDLENLEKGTTVIFVIDRCSKQQPSVKVVVIQ